MLRLALLSLFTGLTTLACGSSEEPAASTGPGGAGGSAGATGGAAGLAGSGTGGAGEAIAPRGPWAMRATETGATLRWETAEAPSNTQVSVVSEADGSQLSFTGTTRADTLTLEYGVDSPLVELPDLPGTYHLTEVVLDGLTPSTCYTYTLVADSTRGGRVCTARPPDPSATFEIAAIGDTSPVLASKPVVEQLVARKPELVLHAGDLQYYSTVIGSWRLWFRDMQPLLSAGAFYPVVGNHEDEVEAEFTNTFARYWDPAGTDGSTTNYHFESGGVHFFAVNSEDIGDYDPTFQWLQAKLTEVEALPGYRFSIVYFHRPIYTLARHAPSLGLRATLQPIIEAHTVPLVLQGHNHAYERFLVNGVTYLVVGNGGSGAYDVDANVAAFPDEVQLRVASGQFYGVTFLKISAGQIDGEAVDDTGAVRDTFQLSY